MATSVGTSAGIVVVAAAMIVVVATGSRSVTTVLAIGMLVAVVIPREAIVSPDLSAQLCLEFPRYNVHSSAMSISNQHMTLYVYDF